jgi:hypothetical protein
MSGEPEERWWAIDRCPRCSAVMPHPSEDDYRLAGTSPAGIWDESVKAVGTGYYTVEDCNGCGAALFGWQYMARDEPNCLGPVCHMKWTAAPEAPGDRQRE